MPVGELLDLLLSPQAWNRVSDVDLPLAVGAQFWFASVLNSSSARLPPYSAASAEDTTVTILTDAELRDLLTLDEEALLERLGREIDPEKHALPPPAAHYVSKAREWLDRHYDETRQAVCSSEPVRSAYDRAEDVAIIAAVVDAIGGAGVVTTAVLIMKRGLKTLCQEYWD